MGTVSFMPCSLLAGRPVRKFLGDNDAGFHRPVYYDPGSLRGRNQSTKERRRPRRRPYDLAFEKKPIGRIVSTRLCSSLPHSAKTSERTDLPSEDKNEDVQPTSFDFTQRSKEGAKNDAPPDAPPNRRDLG